MKFLKFSALQYIAIFLSIVVNFVLARYLNKEDYGFYSFGLVIYGLINGISDYGLDRNGLVRLSANRNESLYQEAVSQFITRIITIVFITIGTLIFLDLNHSGSVLILYVVAAAIQSSIPKYFFDFRKQFLYESYILILDRVVFCFLIACFFLLDMQTNFWIGVAYLIGRILYFIASVWVLIPRTKIDLKIDHIRLKISNIFTNNFVFWLATVSNVSLLYLNQIILGNESGYAALAIFAFAMQFISMLRILQTQYFRWLTPSIGEELSNKVLTWRKIVKYLTRSLIISIFLSSTLFLGAIFIINFYYEEFKESIYVIGVLCCWSFFYGPGLINSYILSNKIKGLYFLIISVCTTTLSVLSGYIFTSNALYLALAISVSHTFAMFIQFYLTYRTYAKNF